MQQDLIQFIKKILLFTTIVSIILLVWNWQVPEHTTSHVVGYIVALFVLINIGTHYLLLQSRDKRPALLVRFFMASTVFKLLFFMGLMLIYAKLNRPDAVKFVISFLFLYMAYSVFEVSPLMKFFKQN